ncbi:MAG: HAD hydrolase-like protein [Chlorobaculum sp.]|nr:HAD hydrolase-like protein [Chlorobaculum sp.]
MHGLERARDARFRLFSFSNGLACDVESLLDHAGIRAFFIDCVSVEEIRSFKPEPAVYRHFMKRAESLPERTCLISQNPFDVTGTHAVGINSLWVWRSSDAVFDPWEFQPAATVSGLTRFADVVQTTLRRERMESACE